MVQLVIKEMISLARMKTNAFYAGDNNKIKHLNRRWRYAEPMIGHDKLMVN